MGEYHSVRPYWWMPAAEEDKPASGICQYCGSFIGLAVKAHEAFCELKPEQKPEENVGYSS